MTYPLFAVPVIAVSVTVLIVAEFRRAVTLIYIVKPLSTLLVISVALWGTLRTGSAGGYAAAVIIGLLLSLGGDVALMPPDSPRRFRIGLVLFLAAHIAYIVAFWGVGTWGRADLICAVVLAAIGTAYFLFLRPNLGSMTGPVAAYIVIISLMVNRAVSTLFVRDFDPARARIIAVGAVLFFISDVILSANRFRKAWRYERISLAFYFSGQLCLALSVGM